jgi:hypothetical protein
MTLVYTSNEGSPDSQLELSTPSSNVARPVLQDAADILTYPAPGGGLLRVPVGGGAPAPLNGSASSGQLVSWDNAAGQWVLTDVPPAFASPVWSSTLNKWLMSRRILVTALNNSLSGVVNLELLPAGHIPGFYQASGFVIVKTVATGGTLQRTFLTTGPGGVAVSTPAGQSALLITLGVLAQGTNGTGLNPQANAQWFPPSTFVSDGSAAIIARFTPSGVTGGPPLVDIYGTAFLESPL